MNEESTYRFLICLLLGSPILGFPGEPFIASLSSREMQFVLRVSLTSGYPPNKTLKTAFNAWL